MTSKRSIPPSDEALRRLAAEARSAARAVAGDCLGADVLARYCEGDLAEAELRAAEDHLSACAACASEAEGLRRLDAEAGEPPGVRGTLGRRLLDELRRLVLFELPPALAVAPRGGTGQGAALREAMEHYAAGRMEEARAGLERAAGLPDSRPEAHYYLGACLLEEGRDEDAVEALRGAVVLAPRVAEHRWLLAQGLLRLGRGVEAAEELDRVARHPGVRRTVARDLASRVRQVLEADD